LKNVFPLKWSEGGGVISGPAAYGPNEEHEANVANTRSEGGAMRISGGEARGIELSVPKGDSVRPATDGMRQAVFSSLGGRVVGARFVDLFAGSGAYGLEAFSRGASGGTFVERSARASACLRRNIASVCRSLGRNGAELVAVEADALSLPTGVGDAPDIIFVDPPYGKIGEIAPALFAKLSASLGRDWKGLVVFEMPGEERLEPEGWTCVRRLGRGARQPSAAIFARAA
jgi:16S rRNA (guanine966-N2)-methyltransferase